MKLEWNEVRDLITLMHEEEQKTKEYLYALNKVSFSLADAFVDNQIYTHLNKVNAVVLEHLLGQTALDDINWFLYDWRAGFTIETPEVKYVINGLDDYLNYFEKEFFPV